MNKCLNRNGDSNPKEIAIMTRTLEEYVDYLRAKNNASGTIWRRLKVIVGVFRLNCVDLTLPYGIRAWTVYYDRAPSREEIQKVLNVADLRERVIITALSVSGIRLGTLLKLQYRHVKHDLEHEIIPIHMHIEATVTKGKRRSYDTFLNEEAAEYLKAYIDSRKKGSKKIPPEQIHDESPLIRTNRCKEVRTVARQSITIRIHDLFVKAGILEKNSSRRSYEVRAHSLRKFFRTQMASLNVDRDYIDYMMGHASRDRYHDVRMKGVEYLRGVYLTSGIRIRPKIKVNRIDALKEIIQSWGLDPQKILTGEALAQMTPTSEDRQDDNLDLLSSLKVLQDHQLGSSLSEGNGA
jgi:integrase